MSPERAPPNQPPNKRRKTDSPTKTKRGTISTTLNHDETALPSLVLSRTVKYHSPHFEPPIQNAIESNKAYDLLSHGPSEDTVATTNNKPPESSHGSTDERLENVFGETRTPTILCVPEILKSAKKSMQSDKCMSTPTSSASPMSLQNTLANVSSKHLSTHLPDALKPRRNRAFTSRRGLDVVSTESLSSISNHFVKCSASINEQPPSASLSALQLIVNCLSEGKGESLPQKSETVKEKLVINDVHKVFLLEDDEDSQDVIQSSTDDTIISHPTAIEPSNQNLKTKSGVDAQLPKRNSNSTKLAGKPRGSPKMPAEATSGEAAGQQHARQRDAFAAIIRASGVQALISHFITKIPIAGPEAFGALTRYLQLTDLPVPEGLRVVKRCSQCHTEFEEWHNGLYSCGNSRHTEVT